MKVFTLFILFFILIGFAEAQKKMLSLQPVISSVLTKKQESLIRKQIILIASKQTKFQILLGEIPTTAKPANLFSVKVTVLKDENKEYSVEANLINEKDQVVISKIKRKKVKSFELMRSSEVALELLFRKYENKNEKIKKEKHKTLNDKSSSKASRRENKNVQFVNAKILDEKQIDFKKRIRELQKSVRISERDAKNEIAKKKKKQGEAQKSLIAKKRSEEKIQQRLQNKDLQEIKLKNAIKLSILNQDTISRDIAEVRTTTQYLMFSYKGEKKFSLGSTWNYYFGADYGKKFSKTEEDVPDYLSLYSGVSKDFSVMNLRSMIGLDFSSFSFVNIPIRGEDTQVSENNLIWLNLGIKKATQFRDKYSLEFGLNYLKSVLSSVEYSEEKNIELSGSKVIGHASIKGLFKPNLVFTIKYAVSSLSNEVVEAKTSEFLFSTSVNF